MSSTAAALLEAALKLPPTERGDLARRLLDSLDPADRDIDDLTDEEFAAELDRRHDEFLRDPSVGVPWEEVRRRSREDAGRNPFDRCGETSFRPPR